MNQIMLAKMFLLGVVILASGIVGVSYVQLENGDSGQVYVILESGESVSLESVLESPDTGFLRVALGSIKTDVHITVLSPTGTELYNRMISTKQSVDYFPIEHDGTYTLLLTLVSANSSSISAELGQINSAITIYPAIVLIIGVIMLVVLSCIWFLRYITAQPDENTT